MLSQIGRDRVRQFLHARETARPDAVLRQVREEPLDQIHPRTRRGREVQVELLVPLQLSLVHVCEESAPDNDEPLEWFLLTSLPVTSRQQALKILEWYRLRWRIEDWHRVLKSGCKVEYLGHRTGERIERAVTINAVIAWRLTAMTLLGRDTPELPADILFSDIEIIALEDFAKDRKLPPPDNLGRAVLTMAMLGGYLNRKGDSPPGHAKLWEGYTRLATTAQTYERLLRLDRTSDFYKRLRSDKTCG